MNVGLKRSGIFLKGGRFGLRKEFGMKRTAFFFTILGFLVIFAGCKKQQSDTDGIRSGINEHLAALKTLNLGAMEMNVQNVSIQGNQAQAQVEFLPKTGAPPGAGMRVSYKLEKQDGKWVVQDSQPTGGTIRHPAPGQNPHLNSTSPSSATLPDFRNLVNSGAGSFLPPGHPPVNAKGNLSAQ
jgi:hypothetical protein